MNRLFAFVFIVGLFCSQSSAQPPSTIHIGGDLIYNDPRWEDLRFPAGLLYVPPGIAPFVAPDWIQFPVGGSTDTYMPCMDASTDEGLIFVAQLPHSRKDNSDVTFHVHWAPSTAASGNVVWQLICTGFADVGEVVGSSVSIQMIDATESTANQHLYISNGTTSGASTTVSAINSCSIYRDADHASDTYGADACLIEVDIHYLVDTPGGSLSELSK